MAKHKHQTREPGFYDFVQASVFDETLAQRMVREKPLWLTITNSIEETALAYVVIENYLKAARFLLSAGADINTRNMSAQTPLMHASGLGHQDLVALLLERGAEVNAEDSDQETALFKAVRYGHAEICEALITGGAIMQGRNDINECLSDVVLPRKREQVLSLLVRHGYRELAPPVG